MGHKICRSYKSKLKVHLQSKRIRYWFFFSWIRWVLVSFSLCIFKHSYLHEFLLYFVILDSYIYIDVYFCLHIHLIFVRHTCISHLTVLFYNKHFISYKLVLHDNSRKNKKNCIWNISFTKLHCWSLYITFCNKLNGIQWSLPNANINWIFRRRASDPWNG